MMMDKALHWRDLPAPVLSLLREGAVIPAHPLALGPDRKFDKQSQQAIGRYYVDAGSGGLAVHAAEQFGEELAVEVRHDHADRRGAGEAQVARAGMRHIAESIGDLADMIAQFATDVGCAVERT